MRPVWPSIQFQASQQLSTISPVVWKTQCERRLSRRCSQSRSIGLSFGRVGRQEDQAEVFRHDEIAARMPARLVHQHNAMRPGCNGWSEFSKKEVHRGGVESGHHQGNPGVAGRAHRPDDPRRLVADIAQPAWGMAALPPHIAGPPLLSDPRLVLAPDFKPLGLRIRQRDFRQTGSEPPFLKAR
jgi:hypothetical protein